MATATQHANSNVFSLSHDEQWSKCAATSEQWLRTAPRGAYTTSRTMGGDAIFDLQHHIERLANSAQLMQEEDLKKGNANAEAFKQAAATLLKVENLRPRVIASLRAATSGFRQLCPDNEGELRLTTLLTWDPADVHVLTHAAPLPGVPKPPIKVQIRGVARDNAKAKDSEWVRQRAAMQDAKPSDVNEILLLDGQGGVLEGMSSNVFVVEDGKVVTPDNGILVGTVRNLVLEVCQREGIPITFAAPKMDDANKWEGMFITSTSRLVLPVDSAELPDGRVLNFGSNSIVEKLEQQTADAIRNRSEKFL